MQAIGEKLNIPVRSAKLYPFGEPAAAEEKDAAAPAGMLEEVQVRGDATCFFPFPLISSAAGYDRGC